jgi:hypothetical protein
MTLLRQSIETYIHAKDGNRPHLMARAFTRDAELVMEVKTQEIAFPDTVKGVGAMANVLVSQFAQRYENIYTLCMGAPPDDETSFLCSWLVCMTEKGSGATRVGLGGYEWLSEDRSGRVSSLRITIEEMKTLPADVSQAVLEWVDALPYPWCPHDQPARTAPDIPAVQDIARRLADRQ